MAVGLYYHGVGTFCMHPDITFPQYVVLFSLTFQIIS